jgi:2-methylcitrate dehydratase PrpD
VTAARFAAGGGSADSQALDGERGFWDRYGPEERDSFSIGDRWAIVASGIDVKAYPCCYFTHAAIAATQDLVADGVDPAAIERVDVTVSPGAADACEHTDPTDGLEAKFSLEYAVASAAVRDRVGLDAFRDEAVADPAVQRLRERVTVSVDDALPYDAHDALVRIETDERTVERHQADPPWTHDEPPTTADLRGKFDECAGAVLADEAVAALYETLASLSSVQDVRAAIADLA